MIRDKAVPISLLPYLALVLGVLGLGMSAIFVRWAGVPGAASGFYRVAIAAAVMALPAARQAQRRRPLSRRHVGFALLAGLFFTGDLATWNTALFLTNATNATLFGNTAPLWVGLGALFIFKEKLGRVFWLGLGLALAGAAVILGADFLEHPTLGLGDLLAMTTGFFYGGFFLAAQRARDGLDSLTSWWIAAVTSAVGLLAISLLLGQPLTGYSAASYFHLASVALVTQVGGYLAINYALGHLPASLVSPTLLAQPVVTAFLAIPLLGEHLNWSQMVGGVLVMAGIWLLHQRRSPA